jgi:hypothetical protein
MLEIFIQGCRPPLLGTYDHEVMERTRSFDHGSNVWSHDPLDASGKQRL